MRAARTFIVAAGVLASATVARAEIVQAFMAGNRLHDLCQRGEAANNYVGGVADGLWASGAAKICVPPDVTVAQVRDVACKFLLDNPASRHKAAAGLIFEALSEAFPCKR